MHSRVTSKGPRSGAVDPQTSGDDGLVSVISGFGHHELQRSTTSVWSATVRLAPPSSSTFTACRWYAELIAALHMLWPSRATGRHARSARPRAPWKRLTSPIASTLRGPGDSPARPPGDRERRPRGHLAWCQRQLVRSSSLPRACPGAGARDARAGAGSSGRGGGVRALVLAAHWAVGGQRHVAAGGPCPRTRFGPLNSVLIALASPPDATSAVLHGVVVGPVAPTQEQRRAIVVPTLVLAHRNDLIHPFDDAVAPGAWRPAGPVRPPATAEQEGRARRDGGETTAPTRHRHGTAGLLVPSTWGALPGKIGTSRFPL